MSYFEKCAPEKKWFIAKCVPLVKTEIPSSALACWEGELTVSPVNSPSQMLVHLPNRGDRFHLQNMCKVQQRINFKLYKGVVSQAQKRPFSGNLQCLYFLVQIFFGFFLSEKMNCFVWHWFKKCLFFFAVTDNSMARGTEPSDVNDIQSLSCKQHAFCILIL